MFFGKKKKEWWTDQLAEVEAKVAEDAAKAAAKAIEDGPCTDVKQSCAYWANKNYCTKWYVAYMTKNCRQSCKICTSACTDSNQSCAYWANLNYCTERYVAYMTKNCRQSCKICTK